MLKSYFTDQRTVKTEKTKTKIKVGGIIRLDDTFAGWMPILQADYLFFVA